MKNYSNLGVFKSKGRLTKEPKSQYRSDFQRDRDRIIHSSAFRRLKHKTQVFVNTIDDHYRTRITHSIEVAQIGRSISNYLNLNTDLVETLSLAHDLGHPPFGHAGENMLNECMTKYGGYDHNIQTLRIVMLLENKYLIFKGLNLTLETLDGLLKHNGPIETITENMKSINNFHLLKNKIKINESPSLEAQIASISDNIAYNNHDIQDGISAGIFKLDELLEINFFKEIYLKNKKKFKNSKKNILLFQIIRDSINFMVKDLIKNSIKNIKINKIKTYKDVTQHNNRLISFSQKFEKIENDTKLFLRQKMYNNNNIIKKNNKGKKIIKHLFNKISQNPKKYINTNSTNKIYKYRAVSDYISGMTDRFAINLYNKIK